MTNYLKNYCEVVEREKTEIEKKDFIVDGCLYKANILYPGTNPLIVMKSEKNIEVSIFLVQDEMIFNCNPSCEHTKRLREELEIILSHA
jgi:hypothetical protein